MCGISMFFFFKQKTAYGLRISDWSSDVCSSDLHSLFGVPFLCLTLPVSTSLPGAQAPGFSFALRDPFGLARRSRPGRRRPSLRSADRTSDVEGKSESVRVDLGGRLIIKQQKKSTNNSSHRQNYIYQCHDK